MKVNFIYTKDKNIIEETHEFIEVKAENKTRITKLENKKKPDGIILNIGDRCYFKQSFDLDTISILETKAVNLKENLTKTVILRDLNEMIRDGKFPPKRFITLVQNWVNKKF